MLDKAGSVLLYRSGSVGTLVSGVSAVGFRLLGGPESSKWQRLTSDGRRAGDQEGAPDCAHPQLTYAREVVCQSDRAMVLTAKTFIRALETLCASKQYFGDQAGLIPPDNLRIIPCFKPSRCRPTIPLRSLPTMYKKKRVRMPESAFVGAIAVGDLVKSTLGPKGMDKILQSASTGEIMVTNDGATILKSIALDNAAAKVLVQYLQSARR
jgi:TCP-1/cpn60 chaperonin family